MPPGSLVKVRERSTLATPAVLCLSVLTVSMSRTFLELLLKQAYGALSRSWSAAEMV